MILIIRSSFLLLAVSTVSLDIATAFRNLHTTQRKLQTYKQYSDYSQEMLDAVNTERAKSGLSALCLNSKLAAAAKRHSDDMATKGYMDHDGSDGSTLSTRVTDAGYDWEALAENIAAGQTDVASVVKGWMESEGHRTNIMNADYTMLGAAYAYSAETTYTHYWTQTFGASTTDTCDSGSSNSSQPAYETQQQDVAGKTLTSQETTHTTTAESSAVKPPAVESPAVKSPAVEPPAIESTETSRCKVKM
ncbi:hypothetical protein KXD40_004187 [Peronospora effusa]|uniref:SCP domain-containing protein n=1 Tax=Peronospora effusa TaxID=542832 RepID=A0A3M6VJQ9_9STRA|nr:hypothetical protein DD238_005263 [Peronospora effusa]RQM18549.1 hypothetical protein DD237_001678 [Peronospora effusa]UIZ28364.1 hypothetical protein KXD40_004187 [Peronospora effusa]